MLAGPGARPVSPFPATWRLVATQTAYQLRTFRRIPVAMFFTIGLPLIMLVLFNALFGSELIETPNGTWKTGQFYTGGLAAFTAVSATYTNLANMVPLRRDEGVLKRWRGTPLPTWMYLAGFIGAAVIIALVGVVLLLTIGVLVYDLDIEAAKMPAALATFLVGVSAFAALGMALAAMVRSASSASAAANATILPLAFVSDVFVQISDPPRWLEVIGNIFPLKPFVNAFQDCFNPTVAAPGFDAGALAWVALWGAAGLFVALRKFSWEPSGTSPRRRRRVAASA